MLDRQHGSRLGQNIIIDQSSFEVVENNLEEEIKRGLTKGNRCFSAQYIFGSTLCKKHKTLSLQNNYPIDLWTNKRDLTEIFKEVTIV